MWFASHSWLCMTKTSRIFRRDRLVFLFLFCFGSASMSEEKSRNVRDEAIGRPEGPSRACKGETRRERMPGKRRRETCDLSDFTSSDRTHKNRRVARREWMLNLASPHADWDTLSLCIQPSFRPFCPRVSSLHHHLLSALVRRPAPLSLIRSSQTVRSRCCCRSHQKPEFRSDLSAERKSSRWLSCQDRTLNTSKYRCAEHLPNEITSNMPSKRGGSGGLDIG